MSSGRVPVGEWFPVPTTVICQDGEVLQWFEREAARWSDELGWPVTVVAGETPDKATIALLKVVESTQARFVSIRCQRVDFDPQSLSLLLDAAAAAGASVVSFEMALGIGSAVYFPASALLRRHGVGENGGIALPIDGEEYLFTPSRLRAIRSELAVLPALFDWHKLLPRFALRGATGHLHVPQLAGVSHRVRRRPNPAQITPMVRQLFEAEFGGLLGPAPAAPTHHDSEALVHHILGLHLAHFLGPASAHFVQATLEERLEPRWERFQAASTEEERAIIACRLADVFNLRVLDNPDERIGVQLAAIGRGLAEEALIGDDPIAARVVRALLARTDTIAAARAVASPPLDEYRGFLKHAREARDSLASWRGECARLLDMIAAERARSRQLSQTIVDLRAQVASRRGAGGRPRS